jgi:hypothetical protein
MRSMPIQHVHNSVVNNHDCQPKYLLGHSPRRSTAGAQAIIHCSLTLQPLAPCPERSASIAVVPHALIITPVHGLDADQVPFRLTRNQGSARPRIRRTITSVALWDSCLAAHPT